MTGKIKDDAMIGGVVAHPLRIKALLVLVDRESSPVEIARHLGIDASHLAYHVRLLHEAGLIRLTETLPKRGSIEHRYRGVVDDHPAREWYESTSPAEVAERAYVTLCVLSAEMNCGLAASSFEEEHRLGRYPMAVDDVGQQELADLYDAIDEELNRIKAEAADRLREAGEPGASVTALSGYFDSPLPVAETRPPNGRERRVSKGP